MTSPSVPRVNIESWRVFVFYAVLALGFSVLVAQLFNLQVLQYETRLAQADENRTRTISVPPLRGIIYDRNGTILARNVPSYNVVITPANLPNDPADIQEVYRELSTLIGVPVNSGTLDDAKLVSACVPGPGIAQLVELQDTIAPYSPVKIQCNISEETARIVREKTMDWPGVSVEIEPVRDYPTGYLTADVIGFLGPIPARDEELYRSQGFLPNRDKVGYSGVEAYFQDDLAGKPGKRVIEVDVAGQELRNLEPPLPPVSGANLITTIDTRLQKAADAALTGEINFWNSYFGRIRITTGAVIAMNPKTGEVLAMVSFPTYENNRMARFIPAYYYNQLAQDPAKPLLNHAVSDQFPPGSVFKLSTATGALNEGVVTLDDWNEAGFGTIDFLHCIAYSSNVCFYKLGGGYKNEIKQGLGIERLREYARALGYDQKSNIELLGEAKGLIPSPQWKRINRGENWSTGDTYIASVGQGYVLSTPLQVLLSAATIANDGKHVQPTLVREITDNNGKPLFIWRDIDGNLYHQCSAQDKAGLVSTGWCDTGFGISNQVLYTVCQGKNDLDEPVSGWCGSDDQGLAIFHQGAWQISPFVGYNQWDITTDPVINDFQCDGAYCTATGRKKTVRPDVVQKIQEGMRLAVTSDPTGTLNAVFTGRTQEFTTPFEIPVAGKTGTAEYCDNVAQAQNRCQFGSWPTHSWTVVYGPYEDPEIVVVAFCYNGGEGASVAAPIVRKVLEAYFELKAIDSAQQGTAP
ncbi:MAG: penicillin-binding transpeptidase domain-containing protein [Chloroflexi bacterium]|nr:penicillin-binding transpeptidase domain-containing protein [Chloroflexota bacterium]